MNIAIHSASAAVARSLQTMAEHAGLTVSAADAVLHLQHEAGQLHLQYGSETVAFSCPVTPRILMAALARCIAAPTPSAPQLAHGWRFDPAMRCITREGESHTLTEKEALLMRALLAAAPDACARETLLKQVWSYEPDIETHTLETHVYRLRQKLEALNPRPCDIETIEGAYRLVLQETSTA